MRGILDRIIRSRIFWRARSFEVRRASLIANEKNTHAEHFMPKQSPNHSVWSLDQSLVHLLHRAVQVADLAFLDRVAEVEITPRQFAVLTAVANDPSASQTQLVAVTGVDRSTLADLVKRLVKKGLLQRKRSRDDARAYEVRLTPRSEALIDRLTKRAVKADEALLAHLNQSERSALLAALDGLIQAATPPAANPQKPKMANGAAKRHRPASRAAIL
jgi:DNA-binding MarR family transcriptional regulator